MKNPGATYKPGDRVQLHPATDAWMSGDRFGEVIVTGRKLIHVKMDRSGRIRRLHPQNILEICEWGGAQDATDPENFWVDDATGERVNARTGERNKP